MLKFISSSVVLSLLLQTGCCDKFTGPGLWNVKVVKKCPEDDAMPVKLDVVRHKINRTHAAFDVTLKLEEVFDDTYAFRSDICKEVDGGCKPYQVLAEDSLAKFVMKYAEGNVEKFMEMAEPKIDPPKFPIDPNSYELKNFVMNYEQLPEDGPYGSYRAKTFVLKGGAEKACLEMHVDFKEKD